MSKKDQELARKILGKNPSCYVLVACGDPCENGKIEVEMTFHGEPTLASYLLNEAQGVLDETAFNEPIRSALELVKS